MKKVPAEWEGPAHWGPTRSGPGGQPGLRSLGGAEGSGSGSRTPLPGPLPEGLCGGTVRTRTQRHRGSPMGRAGLEEELVLVLFLVLVLVLALVLVLLQVWETDEDQEN